MKIRLPLIVLSAIVPLAAAAAQETRQAAPPVSHASERKAVSGPAANLTGRVTVEPVVNPDPPGRAVLGLVTFAPGARSNWHTHPAGQSLYITKGCGLTQRQSGPVMRVCKGDAVYVPAGVRHWHGATDTTAMTHLSISETLDGRNVDWAEPVTDAQYLAGRTGQAR